MDESCPPAQKQRTLTILRGDETKVTVTYGIIGIKRPMAMKSQCGREGIYRGCPDEIANYLERDHLR